MGPALLSASPSAFLSPRSPASLDRATGPVFQRVRILEHFRWRRIVLHHAVLVFKRPERWQTATFELRPVLLIGLEIQCIASNQTEGNVVAVNGEAAEHGPRGDVSKRFQPFDYEFHISGGLITRLHAEL